MKDFPQFFGWRGELGRLDYLKEIIKRLADSVIRFLVSILDYAY